MLKKYTKKSVISLQLLLLTILSSSAKADWFALNMTRGATDISNEVFELHMLIFWICVAIGVVVFGVMFYSMYAHTKKKNPIPSKFHESTKLEITWTVIPFLILIAMAVPASMTLVKIVICAPESIERAITSTPSCIATLTMLFGVCRKPKDITSIPASRYAAARTLIPLS